MRVGRSGVLVGRATQMDALRKAAEHAMAGLPTVVLVEGEAGIGKTRLVRELAEELAASDESAVVATSHGVNLSGGAIPYGVAASLLQDLVLEVGEEPVRSLLGPRVAAVAPLVDGLPTSAGDETAQLDRLALFGAVQRLLGLLTRDRLVCLFAEDLHWADASSLDLLVFLARAARPGRLLIVATTRPVASADPAVAERLGELAAAASAPLLRLGPLDGDAVALQVRDALADAEVSSQFVGEVQRLSDGVPLYVEELLATASPAPPMGAQVASSNQWTLGRLPSTVAVRLTGRLDRLEPGAVRLLQAASVEPRPFTANDLAVVAGLALPEVEAALAAAVDGGLLDVVGPRRYRFHHALLREAVAADLPNAARAGWHRCWAGVFEGRGSLGDLTAIADHRYEGHDFEAALASAVQAALAAQDVAAYREVVARTEGALSLWPVVADADRVAGVPRERLVVILVDAYENLDDPVGVLRVVDEQEGASSRPTFTERSYFAACRFGAQLYLGQAGRDALPDLPDVARLRAERPSWMLHSLLQRCLERFPRVPLDPEPVMELIDEVAAALQMDDAAGRSLLNRCVVAADAARFDTCLEDVTRALEHRLRPPDRRFAVDMRAVALWALGRFREAVQVGEGILEELGSPEADKPAWNAYLEVVSLSLLMLGEHERCDSLLGSLVQPTRWTVRNWATRAIVAATCGRFDDAAECVATVERHVSEVADPEYLWAATLGYVATARAHVAIEEGHPELAFGFLQRALTAPRVGRDIAQWSPVLVAAQAVNPAQEHAIAVIKAAAGEIPVTSPVREAWASEVTAHLNRVAGIDTPEHWDQAAQGWQDLSAPVYEARCRLRLAECLLDRSVRPGRHADATAALQRALDLAAGTGAVPLAGRVTDLARRARLQLTGPPAATTSMAADGHPKVLTDRETDVLRQLVAGRTNDQIGAALFMSPKTASVHVSRIIAKLGAANRTEVVTIAHRLALLEDQASDPESGAGE